MNIYSYTGTKKGFTLVEFLIATAILSVLTVTGVRLVSDSVQSRAALTGIRRSGDIERMLLSAITIPVQTATSILLPSSSLLIANGYSAAGTPTCNAIRLNAGTNAIEVSRSPTLCQTGTFVPIHDTDIQVTGLQFHKDSISMRSITLTIVGHYHDSLGSHDFTVRSAMTSRAL